MMPEEIKKNYPLKRRKILHMTDMAALFLNRIRDQVHIRQHSIMCLVCLSLKVYKQGTVNMAFVPLVLLQRVSSKSGCFKGTSLKSHFELLVKKLLLSM